jgi:ERCC4-related helicase
MSFEKFHEEFQTIKDFFDKIIDISLETIKDFGLINSSYSSFVELIISFKSKLISSISSNSKNSSHLRFISFAGQVKLNSALNSIILFQISSVEEKDLKYSSFQVLDKTLNHSSVQNAGVLKIQFKEVNLKDFDFSINISLNSQENEFKESSNNFFCIFIKF